MTEQKTSEQRFSDILIVDDTPANLQLLTGLLKERGYKARPVPSGKLALQAAKNHPPDLILLDINMPEMDGYEVCERLKADEELKEIPVLFISALNETMDKVKAFSVGGVDYITKPFQFEEVEARVETHLELRRQKRQMQESYNQLRKLEELRDDLVHMIVHDMRTPLTSINGFLQMLEQFHGTDLPAKGQDFIRRALGSTDSLIEMVSSLLDVSKMESGQMNLNLTEFDMVGLAEEVLQKVESLSNGRQLSLQSQEAPIRLNGDTELLSRVLQNLLGNALKFTPDEGIIRLGIESTSDVVRVTVHDTGPGIPPDYQQRIFEKFGQVEARQNRKKYSTGLGLTFCKLAVEAHGGQIGVDSQGGMGSTFWFQLPRSVDKGAVDN